ncbi:MAG TPA: protein-L-isoaspartate(D-aspartate) O-methyltransferase [Candidatus Colwellbacteria bacterium]|nr:protein-L-isoaspartate(D-aspartate) O-methyltransferase [Candidatus Colwellbacteria bacterium]
MAEKINIFEENSPENEDEANSGFVNESYEELIKHLETDGYIQTPVIAEAFRKIDRKDFVPPELLGEAYFDSALAIGFEQTISQPLVVAFMLELLRPKPGERVLDVGSGSGWQAAILAELVGETGQVVGIERIKELAEKAKENIGKYGFIDSGRVRIVVGDGSKKMENEPPFNKIIAAAAAEEIPESWKEELVVGGRIVAPVGQSIVVIDKIKPDQFETKEYFGFSFVPLVKSKN